MPFTPPAWARKITKEQLKHRQITSWEYGYWWIEWGGDHDVIADNERIRFELLSIVMGVWDYIKNSGDFPDSKHWAMDWVGMMPGKRGSRRLVGDYLLKQHDLMQGSFPDAVAIGGWSMDGHPPEGFDRPGPAAEHGAHAAGSLRHPAALALQPEHFQPADGGPQHQRQLRRVHFRSRDGDLRRGRTGGRDRRRAVRGGAPTAARPGARRQADRKTTDRSLLRDDQTIKGLTNQDPARPGAPGNGHRIRRIGRARGRAGARRLHLRDIPDKKGDPGGGSPLGRSGRARPPAWIEFRWDRPQRIREVQLTFDSGFKRQLTLVRAGVAAGQPAPRGAARDREGLHRGGRAPADGTERTLATVRNNFQRLNRHRFEPAEMQSVRVEVQATNGDALARIFEVRCYA